jgi:hypothetical protein
MCGPKFCSMHHSRTIEEGIARLAREWQEREQSPNDQGGEMIPKQDRQLAGVSAS